MILKGKMTLNSINECPLKGKGLLKKVVQQGRRGFGARSVQSVREDGKAPRTPLAAFFNNALRAFGKGPNRDPLKSFFKPSAHVGMTGEHQHLMRHRNLAQHRYSGLGPLWIKVD